MSARQSPEEPDVSWLVVGRGLDLMVGPERALQDLADVRARVSLAEPHMTLGPVVDEVAVAESGVREFVVPWHGQPDGRTVAANPAGGNQVSWNEELDDFRLTPAADALHTSVHVRFVLRHLTTSFLEVDLGGRSVHAVTGSLTRDRGVVTVAGPTRSGKTRLVNRLMAAGLVEDVVDDDCPVLTPDGLLVTLVPRRYEVARAAGRRLAVLVLLDSAASEPGVLDLASAHEFLGRTPTPWPATWLPSGDRPGLPQLSPTCDTVLQVPAHEESVFDQVAEMIGSRSA